MNIKPFFTFFLLAAFYISSLFYFKPYDWAVVGGGDPWGYYAYLPAFFIHHDLGTLNETVKIRAKYRPETVTVKGDSLEVGEALPAKSTGKQVIKYTMGVAFLEAPFFLAAHAYVKAFGGFEADGYTFPYIFAIHLAAIFYVFLGWLMLWKVLRRFHTENVALISIAAVALATNLFYFSVYGSPMAHAFLFFLFTVVVYCVVQWHRSQQLSIMMILALACGLITLIRPVEIIVLLVPLLYGVKDRESFSSKLRLIVTHKYQLAIAALAFFLVFVPQMLYWKWTSGAFMYYSYGEEGFNFASPHILQGVFGYKNGWLAYTPAMYGSLAGIILLWWRKREWFFPIATFLPIHIYIIYSWWCWNYINGFGSRPMVEVYALLIIPLSFFLAEMGKRRWSTLLTALLLLFFTWLNVFNTWQFYKGIMWTEEANGPYFWQMLGKTKMDYQDLVVYDSGELQPDTASIAPLEQFYSEGFETKQDNLATTEKAYNGTKSLLLTTGNSFGNDLHLDLPENARPGDWVRVGVWANNTAYPPSLYNMNVLYCEFLKNGKKKKGRHIRIDTKLGNETNSIWGNTPNVWAEAYFWIKIPGGNKRPEQVKVVATNYSGVPVFLDDLTLEVWREK